MLRNRNIGLRAALTAAAMVGVMVVAACEGENLFSVAGGPGGNANDPQAPDVTITSPRGDSLSAKPLGDSVFVAARVKDNVGVASVRFYGIALRGDPALGTDVVVQRYAEKTVTLPNGVRDTTLMRYLQPTPDSTKETGLIVVEATDDVGNVTADTVSLVLGGPDVRILDIVDGQSIQAGLNLSLRVLTQDPNGITQVRIDLGGAFTRTLTRTFTAPMDSVVVDTVVGVPAGTTGALTVTAVARNTLDVSGQDGPLNLTVISSGVGDTIVPRLKQTVTTPSSDRMEVQDLLTLQVTGSDNTQGGGVASVGYTVLSISQTRGTTEVRTDSRTFSPARTGTVSQTFQVPTFNVDSLSLPDTLVFEVTTWMRDAQGNCGASVGGDTLRALACDDSGGNTVALGRTGERLSREIVAGKTVLLPAAGGRIMDAVVDTVRRNLFLSNITDNRVEVFDLKTESFRNAIGVGSEPWGLALTRDNQSMWVGNSGGTNLSRVNLNTEREDDADRFLTPDVVLFDIEQRTGDAGIQYLITPHPRPQTPSFSDRPQFVAVDSFGNLVYSTKTSSVGDLGTARKGYYEDGWDRTEAKIFVEHAINNAQADHWAIAHIDSLAGISEIVTDSLGTDTVSAIRFFDHVPGFPTNVISADLTLSDADPICDAAARLRAKGGDMYCESGVTWNIPSVTFQDTTYVAASGDGGWVSVGEGGASPVGRVLTYQARQADTTSLTRWLQVSDLLTNPAEEVRGLGLNYDGTLGVVRGRLAAYFISPSDLRLQGLTEIPLAGNGSGATLHPLHANSRTLENLGGEYRPDTHLAFVASGQRTVDIIDTQRFTRVGRVHIRDNITGPLRAVLPFPGDNSAFSCGTIPVTDKRGNVIGNAVRIYNGGDFNNPIAPGGSTEDRCVVVKLFATTEAGGVVVIDVRKADVLNEHPARN